MNLFDSVLKAIVTKASPRTIVKTIGVMTYLLQDSNLRPFKYIRDQFRARKSKQVKEIWSMMSAYLITIMTVVEELKMAETAATNNSLSTGICTKLLPRDIWNGMSCVNPHIHNPYKKKLKIVCREFSLLNIFLAKVHI